MSVKSEKRSSLYLECFLLLFLAGMVSLLFFVSIKFVVEQQIEIHYKKHNLMQYYNERYVSQIQKYITQYNISSKEIKKLDGWINDNRLIYVQVKKDNAWIYSSDFEMDETLSDDYDFPVYPADSYYDLQLSDGAARIFIMGMYSYKAYMISLVADIIVSFLLFFLLVLLGIRKKIIYLNRLSKDIEILEGGNMEYEVYVQGDDEIADLARGLNAMRDSFKNQIEEVEKLTRTNQEMITEISHDLRTPLTSVLLYTEILQNGKYGEEEDKRDYLNKIVRKIHHMKDLSDKLLAYSVQSPEEKFIPAVYLPVRSSLYDELSDMCGYLEEQGINVKANLQWKEGSIFIYEEYLVRILDNITSNILKYADAEALVLIWDEYYENKMYISFENICNPGSSGGDSHGIGIRNMKMMMKKMEGSCEVRQSEEHFQISLRFQYRKVSR